MVKVANAAECEVIYGGGEIDCSKITPTPPISPTPQTPQSPPTSQTQTKGGLTVHKQTDAAKTPATGPEAIGLISLVPMAAAGFYLRKRTNKPS